MADTNGHQPEPEPTLQVVAPQPCPSTFAVNIARIPDPVKGETHQLVLLTIFTVVGEVTLYVEPEQAIAVSKMLALAARECSGKLALASPADVQAVNRAQRRHGTGGGHRF